MTSSVDPPTSNEAEQTAMDKMTPAQLDEYAARRSSRLAPTRDEPGVPSRYFVDIVSQLESRIDSQDIEIDALKQQIVSQDTIIAQLKSGKESAVTILLGDKGVRASIASAITWCGYSVAASLLISVVVSLGADFVYGDLSILTSGATTIEASADVVPELPALPSDPASAPTSPPP